MPRPEEDDFAQALGSKLN